MTNKPRISVIVPVYNAASTLDMSIGSLVGDQFKDMSPESWEIVAVDDGSADGSLETLRKWETLYPANIHVITGANRGVSHARNAGMEAAHGEWLAFVDADDYMLPGSLPALLETGISTGADTVRFGFTMVKADEQKQVENHDHPYSKSDVEVCGGLEFLDSTRGMIESRSQWNACFGLFSRRSVEGIRFPEGLIVGEDCIFTWEVMLRNPKVALVDKDLYIYIQYPSSAMNSTDPAHLLRMMEGRHLFCDSLLDIRRRYSSILGSRAIDGLETVARNAHNEALINGVVLGRKYGDMWHDMRLYKNFGMTVKPGRPRFYNRDAKYTPAAKLRRWIVAYPIPLAMGLADALRGRGLWNVDGTTSKKQG